MLTISSSKGDSSGPHLGLFSKGSSLEINAVKICSKRKKRGKKKEEERNDKKKERKKEQEENAERKREKIRKGRESLGFLS